jgi:DNA topoisomerase-1
LGAADDPEKKFASLKGDQSITSISLEAALKLFGLPRILGEFNGKNVSVGLGRFGPFVKYDNLFASLKVKEGDDPYTIELPRAIQLIEEKIEGVKASLLKTFDARPDIQIVKGRFGPYIKCDRDNYKLPKGVEIDQISLEMVLELMQNQDSKSPKKSSSKKTAAKKTATKKAAPKKAAKRK